MFSAPEPFYTKKWFTSAAWSVGLHLVFLIAALFISIGGFESKPEKEPMDFKLNKVQTNLVVPKGSGGGSGSPASGKKAATLQFPKEGASKGLKSLDPTKAGSRSDALRPEGPEQSPMETKLAPVPSSARNLDAMILENEKEEATQRLAVRQESLNAFYQKDAEKSVRTVAPSGEGLMKSLAKSLGKIQLYSPENVGVNPEEGMPGFTPTPGSGGGGFGLGTGSGSGSGRGIGDGIGLGEGEGDYGPGLTKYEALDNFLDIKVYTYTDLLDGQKYFMIQIYARKGAEALKVMPKEILFAIDTSLSISKDRLDEFKRGIRYCLSNLNPGDLFNIAAFKEETVFFRPQAVKATPELIKEADRFISELTAGQATNVYGALAKIIEKPLARTPSNIILISDGKPTYGVQDSRELINKVTRLNDKVRPVFAFSGGAKVNRYLLDFIAYQNRGWSQFVRKAWDIHGGLSAFYDKIKDPVFLNLRYQLNNVNDKEVFPKSLPDFYRNAEFTLYGTYEAENDFSMQLLGDVDGKTKELVFTRSLADAPQGSEDIKKGYAFNKVYYLISRMVAEGQTPEKLAEIKELSRKYGIQTPYSEDMEKGD